jgi:hypothetical protein
VEGEGALETLSSRATRLGLAEASYGFGRFLNELKLETDSFLRREGARESGFDEISFNIPPTWDQSGCSRALKLFISSGCGLLAVDVL